MAGTNRTLGPHGQLGFHSYAKESSYETLSGLQFIDLAEQETKDRVFFSSRGLTTDFLARVFQTSSQELWRPTRQELLLGGAITH